MGSKIFRKKIQRWFSVSGADKGHSGISGNLYHATSHRAENLCVLDTAADAHSSRSGHVRSYWIRGEWWYNCVFLFPVGIIFAKFEDKIIPHLKKHYWVYLVAALLLFYPLYIYSGFICNIFGYYGDNWGAPDTVFRRKVSLLSQVFLTTEFVFTVLLINMKVAFGNKFLKFMGTITLEFYLIHGLYVELFGWQFDGGVPSPYHIKYVLVYVLVVFALGVPSAMLLKRLHGFILHKPDAITSHSRKAA